MYGPGHDIRRKRPCWLLVSIWSVWKPADPMVGADSLVPDFKKNVFMCMYMSICWHVYRNPQRPERGFDLLELEFQVVVGCLIWMVGNKPQSSGRPARVLLRDEPSPLPTF